MSPLLSETRKTDNKKAPLLSTSRGAFLMFNLKKNFVTSGKLTSSKCHLLNNLIIYLKPNN